MHRRISILAVMAGVIAATGGTAVAAGELITRSDQVARDVIDGGHIKSHSVARTDEQHPSLRLRVRADGGLFGDPGDGTASRIGIGEYFTLVIVTAKPDYDLKRPVPVDAPFDLAAIC